MSELYIICADGACSGNPGPGGWAYEIWSGSVAEGNELDAGAGSSEMTTNNIMELRAATCAIESLIERAVPGPVKLRFDSEYVLNGIFEWLAGWKAKGWKTSSRKPVKNREHWEHLDTLIERARALGFAFEKDWVKGHDGDLGNERVDSKAQEMRDQAKNGLDTAPEPETPVHSPFAATAPASNDDVNPMQVALMKTILDLHHAGDYSVKDVVRQIRQNAIALGAVH